MEVNDKIFEEFVEKLKKEIEKDKPMDKCRDCQHRIYPWPNYPYAPQPYNPYPTNPYSPYPNYPYGPYIVWPDNTATGVTYPDTNLYWIS